MDPKVRQYMMQKYFGDKQPEVLGGADQAVTDAQNQANNAQIAGVAASAADNLSNAFNQPVALRNRMQDLGKAPSMMEGRQQHTDMSGVQRMADNNLQGAKGDRDQALQMMLQQKKEELAAQVAAKRQGVEDDRWNKQFGQKQSEIDATNALKQATLNNAQSQQGVSNDFRRQELELRDKKAMADKAKESAPKPLTAEAALKLANFKNALQAIDEMDSSLKKGDNTFTVFGDNDYTMAQDKFAEGYGRGSSGASITDSERDAFKGRTPNYKNNPDEKTAKLRELREDIQMKIDALQGDQQTQSGGFVKMQDASGKTFNIPANEAGDAEADGLKRI